MRGKMLIRNLIRSMPFMRKYQPHFPRWTGEEANPHGNWKG